MMLQFRHLPLSLLVCISAVSARPAYIRRQIANTSTIAVTGAVQGGVQPRLEIHELQQDADQWNIYLLAIQSFQSMDTSDPMSWYQIAGIHGVPYVSWDGVELCSNCTTTGYCTHSSTLFPTWHRAYLALFEQSLQTNALAVANQFTGSDRERYVSAATRLRAPYWDWALKPQYGEAPFPDTFTSETVTVDTPSGQQTIQNPLLQYSFGNADHSFMNFKGLPDSDVTYRNPTMTATSRQQLRENLWVTLTSNQGYTSFSTASLVSWLDNNNAFSVEMVHDDVHYQIGGEMAYPVTAAFDPVFWLHHTMIDRVFALWQAAYPDQWLEPWSEVGATYTIAKGTVQDSQSPLTPIHSDSQGNFWNSDAVRDTSVLNYNYADLASGQSAADIINSLYRDDESPFYKRTTDTTTTDTQYFANIQVDSMGSEGSFKVFLFDDKVDDDDSDSWRDADSLLGSHGFFSSPVSHGDGSALVNAGISLTSALSQRVAVGKLRSMSKAAVSEYLSDNLELRIRMHNGTVVPLTDIPQLDISIMTAEVEMPASKERLPVWGAFEALTEITKNKASAFSG